MALSLRNPIPQDFVTLASWIDSASACAHWAGPKLAFPFSALALPSLLADEKTSSFSLADSTDALLGFGQLFEKRPAVLHLARIIVAPHARGRGVGKALCELLIAEAVSRPTVQLLTLGVYRDNPAAIALYASLGFVEAPPHQRPDLLSMKRQLIRDETARDENK